MNNFDLFSFLFLKLTNLLISPQYKPCFVHDSAETLEGQISLLFWEDQLLLLLVILLLLYPIYLAFQALISRHFAYDWNENAREKKILGAAGIAVPTLIWIYFGNPFKRETYKDILEALEKHMHIETIPEKWTLKITSHYLPTNTCVYLYPWGFAIETTL